MCVHLQAVSKLGHSNFYCSDELDAITVRKYTERLFLLLTMHEISSKLDHPAANFHKHVTLVHVSC